MNLDKLIFASVLTGTLLVQNINGAYAQAGAKHNTMHSDASPHAMQTATQSDAIPTSPGQDAFGAIQEIITILEADPKTDWSQVDVAGLRAHLVDMNRLVMDTEVEKIDIDGGLETRITGQGEALRAIQAMVPAHAPMIDGLNGWAVTSKMTATGAILTVTAKDAGEIAHIRGLGFYGLMVSDSHHQSHHLSLARGENVHAH